MQFRTTIDLKPSEAKINYSTPVLFVGSCFASYMGEKFKNLRMPVIVNPSGTIYNPASVCTSLDSVINKKNYTAADLLFSNGKWLSLDHYTFFSSENREETLQKINNNVTEAHEFLKSAEFLIVTFGTARVYRLKSSGKIVSNCHKMPASEFINELLDVDAVVEMWTIMLEKLKAFNPKLKVLFTVSPVRHWKDGAHGNQVSKSVLFVAIEKLLKNSADISYFPAYEIVIDDLRDYRFYADDLLHPSGAAIDYIWEQFSKIYFDNQTVEIQKGFDKLHKALTHRIENGTAEEKRLFSANSLALIEQLSKKQPTINLSAEISYFSNI